VTSAAPILFDVFDVLPTSAWFAKPLDEFTTLEVCAESGYLASEACPKKAVDIPNKKNAVGVCTYHQWVQLDAQQQFRVNSSCADLSQTVTASWFVLPPLLEFYYKRSHPTYKGLPPLRSDCVSEVAPRMEFIYPRNGNRISLAKNFEGKTNELVVQLAHTKPSTPVYWYLDETFLGETLTFHEIGILPEPGNHTLTVVDALGNDATIKITIE
jgi:penicillin-binding protein 1C